MVKKDLKLNIKNTQIAQALQLDKLKKKLADKKAGAGKKTLSKQEERDQLAKKVEGESVKPEVEETPRRKARSKSVFAHPKKEKILKEIEEIDTQEAIASTKDIGQEKAGVSLEEKTQDTSVTSEESVVLGPTGRHINDLLTKPKDTSQKPPKEAEKSESTVEQKKPKPKKGKEEAKEEEKKEPVEKKGVKPRFKEYRDLKPAKRFTETGKFDSRDRQGLRDSEEEQQRWRKKRGRASRATIAQEDLTVKPKFLKVRAPISVKNLAAEMKIKASQLIQKLFLQGVALTINDFLEDETTIQFLGQEFDCEISIDKSEEERIRITDETIKNEIQQTDSSKLTIRAPVVTFMGHVDHGKTSLIDYIRNTSSVSAEAGAITQHIGAFLCKTAVGDIAILDTPGHEAFSEMRARGADVTDIVVLVIAGDEGIRAQTEEAINHAKAAQVTIVVAVNKCDKPNFNIDDVHRQLAEQELLPESWGGQTITVKCSAVTGEGIKELLEMLALQAEVLELKANPHTRARGTVLESELHKGMGCVATILVQNGTLRLGDSLVFGEHWGRVKTMRDEFGRDLSVAGPSSPIEITGLSGLPEAGEEFIVVDAEKEARTIAEARMVEFKAKQLQQLKKTSLDVFQNAQDSKKKVLKMVIRADVQGSLEALKAALQKIESEKAEIDIISSGIGEISESDVLLAAASHAMIIGFHTQVESNAESLIKQHQVYYSLHDVIYHAIDKVKDLMGGLLDKIAQEVDKGKAEVKATFKASHLGTIAGCLVIEGSIHRNHSIRVVREGEKVWTGTITSLKRVKEDVREVQKGLECGILLSHFNDVREGDILEAYDVTYVSQEL